MMGNLDSVPVMSINPFWRWAIIPLRMVGDSNAGVAVPFFRKETAVAHAQRHVPICGTVQLLKRTGPRSYKLAGTVCSK